MTDAGSGAPDPQGSLTEQEAFRHAKRDRLLATGGEAYPVGYPRSATLSEVRARYPHLPPDTRTGETVSVTGRVVLNRGQGRLRFATLQDGSGDPLGEAGGSASLQVMVSEAETGPERLADWGTDVDLGDHVGVTGEVITSRRGELSVLAQSWAMTAKALRPLPDKHHGLTDPEARVRQRAVDLVVRPEARRLLYARAAVVRSLRESLHAGGYTEVETPVLQPLHGGAAARPFRTHMFALDLELYLRIALELYLKRLAVGGIERVFEISKVFRNEGVDSSHNPEFTMLEAYEAYGDYNTMADQTRAWVIAAARALGSTVVRLGPNRQEVELDAPWHSATLHELVSVTLGEPIDPGTPVERLRDIAHQRDVALQPGWGAADVVVELFEQLCEDQLIEPTFVRDYPVEVRPLTRAHRVDARLSESWDLYLGGVELGTAYSELVDPVEQRRRLTEQSLRAAGGDPEAMQLDQDFLRVLEVGMPPTGGMGLGVDRLVMLLADAPSIRDVILFPLVRP